MNIFKARTFIAGVTIGLFMLSIPTGAQEIPKGVNYKKASDAINQKAKSIIETSLAAKPDDINLDSIFDDAVVCGPLLWKELKEYASKELRQVNPMTVVIPASKPISMEAKRLITSEQKKEFWKLLSGRIKQDNSFNVRKASTTEIQYYWATIPFDIEEPLYVIDFGKQRVLVHLELKNNQPKIFWMDIVGDLATLTSTPQSTEKTNSQIEPPPAPRVVDDKRAPEGWKRYQFAYNGGDTLSVFLPAEPKEYVGKEQVATDVLITMMSRTFSVNIKTKTGFTSYNAFYADSVSIPASRMTEEQKALVYDALWGAFAKGAVRGFKGAGQDADVKSLERKTITVSGREGIEQDFSVAVLHGRAKIVLAGQYAYVLLALWSQDAPDDQTLAFFNSFEIRNK